MTRDEIEKRLLAEFKAAAVPYMKHDDYLADCMARMARVAAEVLTLEKQ